MSRLALLALAVAAVFVAVRFSPLGDGADELDDRVMGYVYDDMVPSWAGTIVDDCKLPSRAIKGVLRVRTNNGADTFTSWKWTDSPPWSEETKKCMETHLVGRSATPPATRLVVPEGREYEVDLDLTIPVSVGFQ